MSIGFGWVGLFGRLQIADGFLVAFEAHQGAAAIEPRVGETRTNGKRFFDLSKGVRRILALLQRDVAEFPLRGAVRRVVGKFGAKLLRGRLPHLNGPVRVTQQIACAGLLRR